MTFSFLIDDVVKPKAVDADSDVQPSVKSIRVRAGAGDQFRVHVLTNEVRRFIYTNIFPKSFQEKCLIPFRSVFPVLKRSTFVKYFIDFFLS